MNWIPQHREFPFMSFCLEVGSCGKGGKWGEIMNYILTQKFNLRPFLAPLIFSLRFIEAEPAFVWVHVFQKPEKERSFLAFLHSQSGVMLSHFLSLSHSHTRTHTLSVRENASTTHKKSPHPFHLVECVQTAWVFGSKGSSVGWCYRKLRAQQPIQKWAK